MRAYVSTLFFNFSADFILRLCDYSMQSIDQRFFMRKREPFLAYRGSCFIPSTPALSTIIQSYPQLFVLVHIFHAVGNI